MSLIKKAIVKEFNRKPVRYTLVLTVLFWIAGGFYVFS